MTFTFNEKGNLIAMSKKIPNWKKNQRKAMMNGVSYFPKRVCRNCKVEIKRGDSTHFLGQATVEDVLKPELRLNNNEFYSCEQIENEGDEIGQRPTSEN